MVLGERIRDARKAKNLSQEELAKQLFISRSALTKWETGQSMPDIRMLKQLADVLDVSLEYLASDDSVRPDPSATYAEPRPLYEPAPVAKKLMPNSAPDAAARQLFHRVFAAMLLILLHNQYVNWFHTNRTPPLELVPAFIGYFLLCTVIPRLLTGFYRILLQGLLIIGGLAALGGFIAVLGGSRTGAFPVPNLIGHIAAICALLLYALQRRRERELSAGLFWPGCTALMLLMDLWLMLFCVFDLQHVFLYNGANLRLLPVAAMMMEFWGLHPGYDGNFEDSVF